MCSPRSNAWLCYFQRSLKVRRKIQIIFCFFNLSSSTSQFFAFFYQAQYLAFWQPSGFMTGSVHFHVSNSRSNFLLFWSNSRSGLTGCVHGQLASLQLKISFNLRFSCKKVSALVSSLKTNDCATQPFQSSRFSKKFPSKYAEVEFETVLAQGEICLASSPMVQKIPFVTRIWLFSPRRLSRVLPSFPFDFSVKPQEGRIPHHSFSETFKALLMDTCNTQCNDDNQSPKSDLKLIEILKYNYHQLKQRRRGSAGTGRQGIALDLIFKNHRCTQVLSQVSARKDPSLWFATLCSL